MPTIEIASINSTGLGLRQDDFNVAIIEDAELVSHRGLFQDFLRQQKGTIIHIGNPDLKDNKEGGFYAGEVLGWNYEPGDIIIPEIIVDDLNANVGANQQFQFQFLDKFKGEIDNLLQIALYKSPIKKICFLTDYQFGPERANIEILYTISDFWTLHDNEGLTFNTMYEMYGR
jgi:hypothetical protein